MRTRKSVKRIRPVSLVSGMDLLSTDFAVDASACTAVDGIVPNSCNPCQFICTNYCCVSE